MSLRYVLFDAVGTLIFPAQSIEETYAAAGRRYGIELDAADLSERLWTAFAEIFQSAEEVDAPTSETLERSRWQQVVEHVFANSNDKQAIFEHLWTHFALPSSWQLFDDVQPTWSALQSRGFQLGVASNFDQRLNSILAGLLPECSADRIFTSAKVGFAKPSEKFFREIERRLATLPAEILLVGDDDENDFHAPRRFGWQAVLVNRAVNSPLWQGLPTLR